MKKLSIINNFVHIVINQHESKFLTLQNRKMSDIFLVDHQAAV